jgi:hypothetical protein
MHYIDLFFFLSFFFFSLKLIFCYYYINYELEYVGLGSFIIICLNLREFN